LSADAFAASAANGAPTKSAINERRRTALYNQDGISSPQRAGLTDLMV